MKPGPGENSKAWNQILGWMMTQKLLRNLTVSFTYEIEALKALESCLLNQYGECELNGPMRYHVFMYCPLDQGRFHGR